MPYQYLAAGDLAAQLDEEVLGLLQAAAPERSSGVRSISVYRLKGRLNASETAGAFAEELVRTPQGTSRHTLAPVGIYQILLGIDATARVVVLFVVHYCSSPLPVTKRCAWPADGGGPDAAGGEHPAAAGRRATSMAAPRPANSGNPDPTEFQAKQI